MSSISIRFDVARTISAPWGPVTVCWMKDTPVWVRLDYRAPDLGQISPAQSNLLEQLESYLVGRQHDFDIPECCFHGTPFQQAVWQACCSVPYAQTRSYAWIAQQISNPKSVRAVGNALGANRLPILIPCHRIVYSSGNVGGFSGPDGWKQALIGLEQGYRPDLFKLA